MSKMSQTEAELTEQAASLGFQTIQEAEENGYRVTYDNGKLKLVKEKDEHRFDYCDHPSDWPSLH